jgi:hypothetical protein
VRGSLRCGILVWSMSGRGHQLPLGAGIPCGRFTPNSGPYLKLMEWPRSAISGPEQVQQSLTRSPRRQWQAASPVC